MNQTTGGPQPYYAPVPVNAGSSAAIWSLVCGILAWMCFPVVGAILAVVLGYSSRSEAQRYGQRVSGAAMVGIALGAVQLVLAAIGAFVFISLTILGALSSHQ